tara:strand:+ start:641 stop:1021 length:381 start_codon:yes stop_codon:yes gene_type:complete
MEEITLKLYTNGDSYAFKPDNYDGYLFLNYDDSLRNIFYKFIDDELDSNFYKLKTDKQKALSLYNMFYKYIDNQQDIEVYNLSEHNEQDEMTELIENTELEEIFGYEYDEELDCHKVKSLIEFNIA